MRPFNLFPLRAINDFPEVESSQWLLNAEESIGFLKANAHNDEIVIYARGSSILIHGILAITDNITSPDKSDLLNSNIPFPYDSWCIQKSWGGGEGHRVYLEPPLSSSGKSFQGGEKLIFRRQFTGVDDGPALIELSQKLVHSLGLYYVAERKAYCRLDERGDIEDVIKVYQENIGDTWGHFDVVTILRKELDTFMALSNTCLVLKFDFTRVRWGGFGGWGEIEHYDREETDLFYHGGSDNNCSFCNGAMIVRPQLSVDDLVQAWKDEENPSNRKYSSFKIFDRKNGVNVETSCAPGFLSNYFQKSDLPWEVSPAFFRPEVLHRFKADPEKYSLDDRSINCRNAWHLQTYDINEAGQVHTYIVYLAQLPYEEQLYWQAFNEWPKCSISARAHQTDIVGDWYLEYDPLGELKRWISLLDDNPPDWWRPRGRRLGDAVRYPATDSVKEWGDEILALDQYLVEGFQIKPLRQLVVSEGGQIDSQWGSLRLLQEGLVVKGKTEPEAKTLMLPMQMLHALRTEVRGHASPKKEAAVSDARARFGTLRDHFTSVVTECEKSLSEILSIFDVDLKRSMK